MYSREVLGEEQPSTFGVSGKLWRDGLVMYDRKQGSLWSQVNGKAILGVRKGQSLARIPAVLMTWKAWKSLYPNTEVLVKEGEDLQIRSSPYEDYFDNPEALGIFDTSAPDGPLPAKTKVLALLWNDKPIAISIQRILDQGEVVWKQGEDRIFFEKIAENGVTASVMRRGKREPLPTTTIFWFVWKSFYPDTILVE